MQLYKDGCNTLTLGGVDYPADERGIIEVPDDKITSSVWTQGFVSAAGRLAQLAARAAQETAEVASSENPTPAERPAADLPSPDQDSLGPVSGPSPKTKPTKEK